MVINLLKQVIEKCDEFLSSSLQFSDKLMKKNREESEPTDYDYSSSISHQKNIDESIVGSVDIKDPFLVFKDYLRNNFDTSKNSGSEYRDLIREMYKINQTFILYAADFSLSNGNHKKAIEMYNLALSNRFKYEHENQKLDCDYIPVEEELRQASKLYVSLQPMVDRLSLDDARLDLFSSSIAAHTRGKFNLSKAEVLDMISKQFYYA